MFLFVKVGCSHDSVKVLIQARTKKLFSATIKALTNAGTEMSRYIQEVAACRRKYEESCEGLSNFCRWSWKSWKGLIHPTWTICYPKVRWTRRLLSDKLVVRMAYWGEEEKWREVGMAVNGNLHFVVVDWKEGEGEEGDSYQPLTSLFGKRWKNRVKMWRNQRWDEGQGVQREHGEADSLILSSYTA